MSAESDPSRWSEEEKARVAFIAERNRWLLRFAALYGQRRRHVR